MRLKLITAASEEPVTLAEAKAWLRVDEHEVGEDALITSLVARARARFESMTQRSCLQQTFDLYLDVMPTDGAIEIPKAPLVSVTSIKGFSSTESTDTGGTAMTTSDFYVDTATEFGRVLPVSGATYPTATREINGAIVRFVAGYSTSTTGVPDGVKAEIKGLVALLYEHRGDEPEQQRALQSYDGGEFALPTWG